MQLTYLLVKVPSSTSKNSFKNEAKLEFIEGWKSLVRLYSNRPEEKNFKIVNCLCNCE